MSRRRLTLSWRVSSFPRVSGDEPGGGVSFLAQEAFSPRERG